MGSALTAAKVIGLPGADADGDGVAVGAGVAVAVGAGFGAVAIKGKNDLEGKCPSNQCASSYEGQLNSAKTAGTISTVAFGVGAAAVVLGTVLYFTATPSLERAPRAEKRGPRAWVGVGDVGFATDF